MMGYSFQTTVAKNTLVSLFLLVTLLFFFLLSSTPQPTTHRQRSLLPNSRSELCTSILPSFTSPTLLNYSLLHRCIESRALTISILFFFLTLHFTFLIQTATHHFSPTVSALSTHLRLSPSMGAVTLLALGNGAPDVFASIAAVRSGQPRTGIGAILSAGAFVSALVVGFVAVYAGPFVVDPGPFIRDIFFYLLAVLGLFSVYLSAEIYLWQALGFVGFYFFFIGFVFWMDLGLNLESGVVGRNVSGGGKNQAGINVMMDNLKVPTESTNDLEIRGTMSSVEEKKSHLRFCSCFKKVSRAWEYPISTVLKLTIPSTSSSKWSRFYSSANIVLCPLTIIYSFRSFISLDHQIVFLVTQTHFPLWSIILFPSLFLGLAYYIHGNAPSKKEMMMLPVVLISFVTSVFWISTIAGELLNCLAAVGTILNLPPALLGLTVLAWGNSAGDLFADVSVAKAGQPSMAMSGCFAGPMFNMLVGLGTALVIETSKVHPEAYVLRFHISIVVAFVFLLLSLMGSLLVVTWFRFRVTRSWGFCLVVLYLIFMATSLAIAKFSG